MPAVNVAIDEQGRAVVRGKIKFIVFQLVDPYGHVIKHIELGAGSKGFEQPKHINNLDQWFAIGIRKLMGPTMRRILQQCRGKADEVVINNGVGRKEMAPAGEPPVDVNINEFRFDLYDHSVRELLGHVRVTLHTKMWQSLWLAEQKAQGRDYHKERRLKGWLARDEGERGG